MITESIEKIIKNTADTGQVKEYMQIIKKWENAGILTKPLTPVRDDTVIVPNKQKISSDDVQSLYRSRQFII